MSFDYYLQASLWQRKHGAGDGEIALAVLELLPEQARRILDAGCGNGAITNLLPNDREVFGCDISSVALQSVRRPRCAANLSRLPFPDGAFDLVMATDVLEHIPDEDYASVCGELARVTRRWILVAVPNRELLAHATVACWRCGAKYHVHWHQRSYNAAMMNDHWRGVAAPAAHRLAGARWAWSDAALLQLQQTMCAASYPFAEALCPNCGAGHRVEPLDAKRMALQRHCEALHHTLAQSGSIAWPAPSEMLVLFDKGASVPVALEDLNEGPPPELPRSIDLAALPKLRDPQNYGRQPSLVADGRDSLAVVLPRLPRRLQCDARDRPIAVYDHEAELYVPLPDADTEGWRELPAVAPTPYGYALRIDGPFTAPPRLRIDGTQDPLAYLLQRERSDPAADYTRARIESLLTLTDELEAKRSEAESRVKELLSLSEELEAKRSGAETRVKDLLSLSEELEVKRSRAEARVKDLLALTEELEQKRSGTEARAQEILSLNHELDAKLADARAELRAAHDRMSREGLVDGASFATLLLRLRRSFTALARHILRLPPGRET